MVRAEDAIQIYHSLSAAGIQVWLTGGWGIDALLQKQTRPHKDLDILMEVDDAVPMRNLLRQAGYSLKGLWSENVWVLDTQGTEIPTAFVLQDSEGSKVDAHATWLDGSGRATPAWASEGLIFSREDLAGEGTISGFAVRCISPQTQLRCHMSYDLPPEQVRDVELLRAQFGVESPQEQPNEAQAAHRGNA